MSLAEIDAPIDNSPVLDQARRLRALMNSKDCTQQVLADHIGITHQQVNKYVSGQNRISIERMKDICAFFGIGLDYFIDEIDSDQSFAIQAFQNRSTFELVEAFNLIRNANARRALITLAQSLAEDE